MNSHNKGWFDFVWVLVLNLLQIVVTALLFVLIANGVGSEEYGIYIIAVTIGMFATLSNGWGSEFTFLMLGSKNAEKTSDLFGSALTIRIVLILPCLCVCYFYAIYSEIADDQILSFMVICFTSLLAGFCTPLLTNYYRIIGKTKFPWIMMLLFKVLFLFLVFNNEVITLTKIVSYYFFTTLLLFSVFTIDIFHFMKVKCKFSLSNYLSNYKLSSQFFYTQLVDLIFSRMDVFFLQLILGSVAVGIYTLGYKIVGTLIALPSAIHIVMQPLFHKNSNNNAVLMKLFFQTRAILIELSALLFTYLIYYGIAPFKFALNIEYHATSSVISVVSVFMAFNFIAYPYAMLAEAHNKVRERLYARIISTILTACLLVPLIYIYGILGAAVSITIGIAVYLAILHIVIIRLKECYKDMVISMTPYFVALLAIFLEASTINEFDLPIVEQFVSFVVYIIFFVILGSLSKSLKYLNFLYIPKYWRAGISGK